MDVKPGSMGRPLPGIEAAVLRRDEHGDIVTKGGEAERLDRTGEEGELALRPGWPSMFRGYLHEEERYRKCFVAGWYLSGDLVRSDADGYSGSSAGPTTSSSRPVTSSAPSRSRAR